MFKLSVLALRLGVVWISASLSVMNVWAEPRLELNTTTAEFELGEPFVVDILLKEMPLTHSGKLVIKFDARYVQALGVVFSGVWNTLNDPGLINNEAGSVTDISFMASPGIDGTKPIASLWFVAIKIGESVITAAPSSKNSFKGVGHVIPVRMDEHSFSIKHVSHQHEHSKE